MKQALAYSFKTCFTALALTPILTFFIWQLGNQCINYISHDKMHSMGLTFGKENFGVSTLIRTFFQIIPFYVLYFASTILLVYLSRVQIIELKFIKPILSLIAVLLTFSSFAIYPVKMIDFLFNIQLAWIISFGLLFIIGIWIYRL